jgi:hypothetical protein
MRVFLCAFTGFSLAIPMSSVSSLALYADGVHSEFQYISLPRLFNLSSENIRHIIFLKNNTQGDKINLLSTEVECEIDIPDEEIYPIPKVFHAMRFSGLFSGIMFDSHQHKSLPPGAPVLFLNHELLAENLPVEEFAE